MAIVKLNGQTGIMQGFDAISGARFVAYNLAWSKESEDEIYNNLQSSGGNGETVRVEVTDEQAKQLQSQGDFEIEF